MPIVCLERYPTHAGNPCVRCGSPMDIIETVSNIKANGEHQRLKDAVVDQAKRWITEYERIATITYSDDMKDRLFSAADGKLRAAVISLLEFEDRET